MKITTLLFLLLPLGVIAQNDSIVSPSDSVRVSQSIGPDGAGYKLSTIITYPDSTSSLNDRKFKNKAQARQYLAAQIELKKAQIDGVRSQIAVTRETLENNKLNLKYLAITLDQIKQELEKLKATRRELNNQ